ncbi:MAG: hypothetical protein V3571_14680 [Pseudodesulfovibrio sp.]
MQKYANHGGDSGIEAFRISDDSICLQFMKSGTYTYTLESIGAEHLENMKRLAIAGEGLNEYLNRNREVYNGWASKGGRELYR